jgi:WD40 repeat protein
VTTGEKEKTIIAYADSSVNCMTVSSDGELLATGTGGDDRRIKIWSVKDLLQSAE